MNQQSLSYPSKEKIRDTILFYNDNKSYRNIAAEAHMSCNTLMRVVDLEDYSFPIYERAVAYCRTLAPNEDWSYPSLEELAMYYHTHKLTRRDGFTPSLRSSFLHKGCLPKVDTYCLLCNIKFKKEETPCHSE